MVHIGNLDAVALAQKLATPYPSSAADWPELQIQAVVPQPDETTVVLLLVSRPRYDGQLATLVVQLDGAGQRSRSVQVLSGWCKAGCSLSPLRRSGAEIELRRRQSLERVRGRLLAEDTFPARLSAR
jgi:hypothetical protein